YDQSDAIYYMDQSNLSYLRRIVDDRRGILRPITELVPDLEEIEDPWYTGRYQRVVNQIRRCVEAILADLRKRLDL
nr:hypothetical protein [Bacilli bacterium]